jgi:hypothetical protein
MAELVELVESIPLPDVEVALAESALAGGVSVFADGVRGVDEVSALDPAEDDPEDAKEEVAPAPVVPADAFD